MDEFYTKLAEILEVDEVREDSQLESFPAGIRWACSQRSR